MTAEAEPGPLLAAAQAAAACGWPVFPLQPYGKRPAVRAWPHRATCDPDQLAGWWARSPFNVGIACGPAGLLVVDLDPGAELRLPATFTVATPRGRHHYFAVPVVPVDGADDSGEEFRRRVRRSGRTTAGALGRRIDTRAAGGYVVAAGSVRLVSGRRVAYRVVSPSTVSPVPAPQWLLEALVPPRPQPAGEPLVRPGAYARAGPAAAELAGRARRHRARPRPPPPARAAGAGGAAEAPVVRQTSRQPVLRVVTRGTGFSDVDGQPRLARPRQRFAGCGPVAAGPARVSYPPAAAASGRVLVAW